MDVDDAGDDDDCDSILTQVLMLSHPRRMIRDTSRYRPFRKLFSGRTPSLRALTERVLGIAVQAGEHDSIEDARATMRLYTSVKRAWESGKRGRAALDSKMPQQFNSVDGVTVASRPPMQSVLDITSEYEVLLVCVCLFV